MPPPEAEEGQGNTAPNAPLPMLRNGGSGYAKIHPLGMPVEAKEIAPASDDKAATAAAAPEDPEAAPLAEAPEEPGPAGGGEEGGGESRVAFKRLASKKEAPSGASRAPIKAAPSFRPKQLTTVPSMKDQVIQDMKRKRRGNQDRKISTLETMKWAVTWLWTNKRPETYRCLFLLMVEVVMGVVYPQLLDQLFSVQIPAAREEDEDPDADPGDRLVIITVLVLVLVVLVLGDAQVDFKLTQFNPAGGGFIPGMKATLGKHISSLSQVFLDSRNLAHMITSMETDIPMLNNNIYALFSGLKNILLLLSTMVVLFTFSWEISLGVASVLPLIWIYNESRGKSMTDAANELRDSEKHLGAAIEENLTRASTKKLLGLHAALHKEVDNRSVECAGKYKVVKMSGARATRGLKVLAFLLDLMVIGVGAFLLTQGRLEMGTFFAYYIGSRPVQQYILNVMEAIRHFQVAKSSLRTLEDFLSYPLDDRGSRGHGDVPPPGGRDIELKSCTFCYPGKEHRNVVDCIDLVIPGGAKVGLLAKSGVGKSTFLKVVSGLYPPDSGEVLIGGAPLEDWNVFGTVASVEQEFKLFEGSVRDNMMIGLDGVDEDSVTWALQTACLYDDVLKMEHGVDSPIGYHGSWLPGGQQQRLTIARALVRMAPVLLMDEPLSAQDIHASRQLSRNFARLQDTTVIASTHNLSLLDGMDLILVLEDGRAAEFGPKKDLLRAGGIFHSLMSKAQGFEQDDVGRTTMSPARLRLIWPFFKLSMDELEALQPLFIMDPIKPQEVLYEAGEQADTMYVLAEGCVEEVAGGAGGGGGGEKAEKGKRLRLWGPGDSAGEEFLSSQNPERCKWRTTALATSQSTMLYMRHEALSELYEKQPKLEEKVSEITHAVEDMRGPRHLRSMWLFAGLSDEMLEAIGGCFRVELAEAGDDLFHAPRRPCRCIYVVVQGRIAVEGIEAVDEDGDGIADDRGLDGMGPEEDVQVRLFGVEVSMMRPGQHFGRLFPLWRAAAMRGEIEGWRKKDEGGWTYRAPEVARAVERSVILSLHEDELAALCTSRPEVKAALFGNMRAAHDILQPEALAQQWALSGLPLEALSVLADNCQVRAAPEGMPLVKAGEMDDTSYLVVRGGVTTTTQKADRTTQARTVPPGEWVNEMGLLSGTGFKPGGAGGDGGGGEDPPAQGGGYYSGQCIEAEAGTEGTVVLAVPGARFLAISQGTGNAGAVARAVSIAGWLQKMRGAGLLRSMWAMGALGEKELQAVPDLIEMMVMDAGAPLITGPKFEEAKAGGGLPVKVIATVASGAVSIMTEGGARTAREGSVVQVAQGAAARPAPMVAAEGAPDVEGGGIIQATWGEAAGGADAGSDRTVVVKLDLQHLSEEAEAARGMEATVAWRNKMRLKNLQGEVARLRGEVRTHLRILGRADADEDAGSSDGGAPGGLAALLGGGGAGDAAGGIQDQIDHLTEKLEALGAEVAERRAVVDELEAEAGVLDDVDASPHAPPVPRAAPAPAAAPPAAPAAAPKKKFGGLFGAKAAAPAAPAVVEDLSAERIERLHARIASRRLALVEARRKLVAAVEDLWGRVDTEDAQRAAFRAALPASAEDAEAFAMLRTESTALRRLLKPILDQIREELVVLWGKLNIAPELQVEYQHEVGVDDVDEDIVDHHKAELQRLAFAWKVAEPFIAQESEGRKTISRMANAVKKVKTELAGEQKHVDDLQRQLEEATRRSHASAAKGSKESAAAREAARKEAEKLQAEIKRREAEIKRRQREEEEERAREKKRADDALQAALEEADRKLAEEREAAERKVAAEREEAERRAAAEHEAEQRAREAEHAAAEQERSAAESERARAEAERARAEVESARAEALGQRVAALERELSEAREATGRLLEQTAAAPPPPPPPAPEGALGGEAEALRGELEQERSRAEELEAKVRELEGKLQRSASGAEDDGDLLDYIQRYVDDKGIGLSAFWAELGADSPSVQLPVSRMLDFFDAHEVPVDELERMAFLKALKADNTGTVNYKHFATAVFDNKRSRANEGQRNKSKMMKMMQAARAINRLSTDGPGGPTMSRRDSTGPVGGVVDMGAGGGNGLRRGSVSGGFGGSAGGMWGAVAASSATLRKSTSTATRGSRGSQGASPFAALVAAAKASDKDAGGAPAPPRVPKTNSSRRLSAAGRQSSTGRPVSQGGARPPRGPSKGSDADGLSRGPSGNLRSSVEALATFRGGGDSEGLQPAPPPPTTAPKRPSMGNYTGGPDGGGGEDAAAAAT